MTPVHLPFARWWPQAECLSHQAVTHNLAELWHVNSLTLGLKALSPHFGVKVLTLADAQAYADESVFDGQQPLFCREVVLSLDDRPVVWARSVCTKDSQAWLSLLDCGTQPLGQRLFDGSLPITRSPFEYAVVSAAHPMLPAQVAALLSDEGMAARRSVFWWQGAPLLLTECFLPSIEEYL